MPLMPMPPMPTKWIGPMSRGSFMAPRQACYSGEGHSAGIARWEALGWSDRGRPARSPPTLPSPQAGEGRVGVRDARGPSRSLPDRDRGDGRAGGAFELERGDHEGELIGVLGGQLVGLHVLQQMKSSTCRQRRPLCCLPHIPPPYCGGRSVASLSISQLTCQHDQLPSNVPVILAKPTK